MRRIKNKKAVNLLAVRSFRANRTRNIIAASAIALTAILFTTLFTLGSGAVENLQRASMRQAGGGGHAVLKLITDEDYGKVKDKKLFERISYNRILADSVDNEELIKRRGEFYYMDETGMDLTFCTPTSGRAPQAENEIMTDEKTLKLLGVPREVGAPVRLSLTVHGKSVTRDFVLSGWWEADPVFNVAIFVASPAYVEAHEEELYDTYEEDSSMTGRINSYLMFKNSLDIQGRLERLLGESGLQSEDESAPGYVASNTNWAYLAGGFSADPGMIFAVAGVLVLIMFTGYLIIYNVFQISVVKDVRFYGLLKTVGATGRQLTAIIRRQALYLSAAGIPAGLLLGFLLGRLLVPVIMDFTFNGLGAGNVSVRANPLIFVGSALFALITVLLSTWKPGKLAASVSPVEASRYNDNDPKHGGEKKGAHGGKLPRMALSNLSRNKKRSVLSVLSMALGLVLLNTVMTLSGGFDMNKFLARFTDTDFLVAQAEYFNYAFRGPENELSETMIEAVQSRHGFLEGGRFFGNNKDAESFTVEDSKISPENPYVTLAGNQRKVDMDDKGNPVCAVYGLEELPLGRLEVVEGELDPAKLATGDYILEGLLCDDYDRPEYGSSHFEVGDTVTLHNYKGPSETRADNAYTTRTFTVLAKVKVATFTNSDGVAWDYNFYLPAEAYKTMVEDPGLMSYAFNVDDGEEAAMEAFLKDYTDNAEPTMHFTSKVARTEEFRGMQLTVTLIGGVLSVIVGLVGVLNFVNTVLTGIVTRRREFATMEAVGMTGGQLKRMLTLEGLYYALFTAVLALAGSVLFSLAVVRGMLGGMWFLTYRFILWPVMATLPMLFLLAVVIPRLALRFFGRQSIVERLKEAE